MPACLAKQTLCVLRLVHRGPPGQGSMLVLGVTTDKRREPAMGMIRSFDFLGKRLRWIVVLGLLVAMVGCGGVKSPQKVGAQRPDEGRLSSFQFEDVPVPSGLTIRRQDSFVYEAGRVKTGIVVYEGQGDISQLSGFFKEKMPQHEWSLLGYFELQNAMLVFMKEKRMAVIYIVPQEGEQKRIEIRVGPVEVKPVPTS